VLQGRYDGVIVFLAHIFPPRLQFLDKSGGQQTADSKQQTTDSRQQRADNRQNAADTIPRCYRISYTSLSSPFAVFGQWWWAAYARAGIGTVTLAFSAVSAINNPSARRAHSLDGVAVLSGVTVVLQWCHRRVSVMLMWCYSVVTVCGYHGRRETGISPRKPSVTPLPLLQCHHKVVAMVLQLCYYSVPMGVTLMFK
jgi:hypothetical protein